MFADAATPPGAVLNETIVTVSLSFSTAPGTSRQLQTKAVCDATENVEAVVSFASTEGEARGMGGVTDSPCGIK